MAVSWIYFPLRTSVEFFRDPSSLAAVTRVKEAAILYDEVVVVEGGIRRDPDGRRPDQRIPPTGRLQRRGTRAFS